MTVEDENIRRGMTENIKQINQNIATISGSLGRITQSMNSLKRLSEIGMTEILPREELRTGYFSFENIVERLISQKAKNTSQKSEIMILGSSMNFFWKEHTPRDYLLKGLKQGVNFKFSLFDPRFDIWGEDETTKSLRENITKTLNALKTKISKQDFTGTLEIRTRSQLFGSSFSSHIYDGKRVSVYEIYGESPNRPQLRYSQIFEHEPEQQSFPYYLYRASQDYYDSGQIYFHYPARVWNVSFCGINLEGAEPRIVLIRKNRKGAKWVIPTSRFTSSNVEDVAGDEFLRLSGYRIDIKKRSPVTDSQTSDEGGYDVIYIGEAQLDAEPRDMEYKAQCFPIKDLLSRRAPSIDPRIPAPLIAELRRFQNVV